MANQEVTLMKGNEAIAHACIRCGADGFFGYPITPQSEIIETLALLKPWETSGMVVLQAESEVAAINMVYGGAGAGKRVITTSSSPGVALMQEGISYMAGAEIPGVIVNVQRGGPGLGTIQPSQSDYFQATRGGGNGDYNVIVLAPASVQEMADFVDLAFTLAFKYRNPAMILSDGVIGQMMEKVVLPPVKPRRTEEEIARECPWATIGRPKSRPVNIMTSLELKPEVMEERNIALQEKYRKIRETEVRYETEQMDDADYVIVAFGSAARIAEKSIESAREQGIKVGLFRPITLWPFPEKEIHELAKTKKGILVVEINAGQMVQDVRLAVNGQTPVEHFGRLGGIVPDYFRRNKIQKGKGRKKMIKVADTGKGISESNQAAIFRRFYREEEVHEQQGVGIGLYLAREIVTRQGGYIKVVSEPGKGSEFSIMLPTK